jgi:hypothetical protein
LYFLRSKGFISVEAEAEAESESEGAAEGALMAATGLGKKRRAIRPINWFFNTFLIVIVIFKIKDKDKGNNKPIDRS